MAIARLLFLTFIIGLGLPLAGQEKSDEDRGSEGIPEEIDLKPLGGKKEALIRILVRRETLEKKIEDSRKNANNSELTDFERADASERINRYQTQIEDLDTEFSQVATGIDFESLDDANPKTIDLNEEIREVFKPLVQEFRDITAAPREAEDLKTKIDDLERRLAILDEAEESLNETISEENPPDLKLALDEKRTALQNTRHDLQTELGIAQTKLADRVEDSPTFLKSVSTLVQDFFRSRGAHLLMAILAALVVVLLIRLLYRVIMKFSPKKVHRGETFTGRLIHLGLLVVAFLGGVFAFVITLYLANDWLLLTLALLFLFGIAWTGKQTLPRFFEQAKMMLNLGTVRYGERLIYDGIPWEVQKINFYTTLKNPALEGGLIRLPMRDLMPLHSRPNGTGEMWFPSREDDWVILSDGTFGKVLQQTPDYVHLVKLGGSRKVIPTADFLSLHPENISKNFRIVIKFGIDYAHQEIATERVPQIFEAGIQRALLEKIDKEQLSSLKVFFHSASASSLDYRIVADFDGELAPRMNALQDSIQATCVDLCNTHRWSIPFTQITLHQAEKTVSEEDEPAAPRLP